MKKHLTLLCLFFLASLLPAQSQKLTTEASMNQALQNLTAEEKSVYDSYRASCDAMINKDKAALEKYFDKDLVFVHMSGKRQTRSEYIAEIMDGTLNYYKITDKSLRISVDENRAHIDVTHALNAKVYGIRGEWTMRGSFTYEKRGGIWVRVENE